MDINAAQVRRVIEVIDHGLSHDLGTPILGQMCAQAAVCYALGFPFSDRPTCVTPLLRTLGILLNDRSWSSKEARARGLRRFAVAQLGSKGNLKTKEFMARLIDHAQNEMVPLARSIMMEPRARGFASSRSLVVLSCIDNLNRAPPFFALCSVLMANQALADASISFGLNDENAVWLVRRASPDNHFSKFAEVVVQILIAMKAPGTKWLYLTEASDEAPLPQMRVAVPA